MSHCGSIASAVMLRVCVLPQASAMYCYELQCIANCHVLLQASATGNDASASRFCVCCYRHEQQRKHVGFVGCYRHERLWK